MSETKSLSGKAAVVTGGSSGIGQYTALGLAERGAKVVITARSAARLAETAAWIRDKVPGAEVETETVDFASFASVRALAAAIRDRYPRLAILVNNAGMVTTRRVVTEDGFESLFQINHLSPFLLTNLVLPSLKDAAPSRIVITASNAAQSAKLDFDDLQLTKGWGPMKAYGRSKLGNIMFTYALARRLEGSGVTVNCFHPGFVGTRIGNKGGAADLVWAMIKPFVLTSAQGAETAIFAATAPEMEGVSGQYLVKKKPVKSNEQSYDTAVGERLWAISAEMVGLGVETPS
jgi:NAD(P)-dependent dehydrogenase (short-subunit alcohol dehydrogenase family)